MPANRCPSNLPMKSFKNAPPVPRSFGPGRTLAEHLCKMNNPSTQKLQSSEMMTFIYTLECPISGFVVYVGKSNNPPRRLRSHLSKPCSVPMRKWIASLPESSKPILKIIETCPLRMWEEREIYWIKHFRAIGPLINICGGGNGLDTHTAETRAAFGAKHRGKVISEDARRKIRAALLGKKLSPERVQKLRERTASMEARARMSAAQRGKKLTPEHRAKLRGRKWSAEQLEKARARRHTPETRAKMSAAQKARRLTLASKPNQETFKFQNEHICT